MKITKEKIKKDREVRQWLNEKVFKNKMQIQNRRFYNAAILSRGIYKLFRGNELVYVGVSKTNVILRICQHYSEGVKDFDSFSFRALDRLTDIQLEDLEVRLIKQHAPKYNIIHNDGTRYRDYKKLKSPKNKKR